MIHPLFKTLGCHFKTLKLSTVILLHYSSLISVNNSFKFIQLENCGILKFAHRLESDDVDILSGKIFTCFDTIVLHNSQLAEIYSKTPDFGDCYSKKLGTGSTFTPFSLQGTVLKKSARRPLTWPGPRCAHI